MNLSILTPTVSALLCTSLSVTYGGIILGTGTNSLIGNDFTDPFEENGATLDGTVTTASISIGTEGAGGEHAYRVFDNGVNPPPPNPTHDQARSKVCCTGVGGHITIQLDNGPQIVRSYTISTANDSPGRDPSGWQVLGSNNGTDFTLIDEVTGNTWNSRHEVQLFSQFSQGQNTTAYEYLRFVPVTSTGGGDQFAISEIEYLGLNANSTGTILGTGSEALLGNDRVDTDFNATFFGDNEPFSDGAE